MPPLSSSIRTAIRRSRILLVVVAFLVPGPALAASVPAEGSAPEAPPLAATPWLVPFEGVGPQGSAGDKDLEALARWMGDARIVGLGEVVHGADDFHRLAHRLFAHLAAEEGFEVFAVEVSQAHLMDLDDYVQGARDDLDALLARRWWVSEIFYDQAFRELLVWMREQNQRRDRKLRVAGFDFKQPSFALDKLRELIGRWNPEARGRAEDAIRVVEALGGLGVFPDVYGFTATSKISLPPAKRALRLSARLRAEGLSHGWVGVGVTSGEGVLKQRFLKPEDLSGDWSTVEIEIPAASEPRELKFFVFHRGNGTLWIEAPRFEQGKTTTRMALSPESLEVSPLPMKDLQARDYSAHLEAAVEGEPEVLRIACAPRVDRALQAVDELGALLEGALERWRREAPEADSRWPRQLLRLVEQSVHWRTLVENNRDVFLAENLAWIQSTGMPGSRVLALGHTSHTERLPGRMGELMDQRLGDSYVALSMQAVAGSFAYFGPVQSLAPGEPLQTFELDHESTAFEHRLHRVAGEAVFDLRGARRSEAGRQWAQSLGIDLRQTADLVILLEEVRPLRFP